MKTKLLLFTTSCYLANKMRNHLNIKPKIYIPLKPFLFNPFLSNTIKCSSEYSRPYLGCSIRQLESGIGMEVVMVKSDSPAELSGIRVKDVILEIDGKNINTIHDYNGAVGSEKGKKKVKIMRKIQNQEKIIELNVEFIK